MRFELPNGISIAADSYGRPGNQPVLFLHGGGQTRHAWGGTAEALADRGFHAICMDHRGHGDSSWAGKGEYQLDDFVEDLLAVVEQLEHKPILVGASLGGITALLAETSGDRSIAKGLILVDVTPRLESEGVERILGFMKGGARGFASLEEAADTIASYLPHRRRPQNLSGLAKNLRLMEDGRYHWHWDPEMLSTWEQEKYSEADERALKERLSHIRHLDIPTLLIRGRLSDLVSIETASEFLEMVPHAEYVDLADAHHMVAGDQNDAFTDTVVEFLLRRFAPSSTADQHRAQRTS
jgi:non-heme chloroperoxidase